MSLFRKKKVEPTLKFVEIDIDSGLPKLPYNYYWVVGSKEGYSCDWGDCWKGYGISIRSDLERGRLYRSSVVEKGDIERKLRQEAEQLAVRFYHDRHVADEKKRLAGEYPPKRLG